MNTFVKLAGMTLVVSCCASTMSWAADEAPAAGDAKVVVAPQAEAPKVVEPAIPAGEAPKVVEPAIPAGEAPKAAEPAAPAADAVKPAEPVAGAEEVVKPAKPAGNGDSQPAEPVVIDETSYLVLSVDRLLFDALNANALGELKMTRDRAVRLMAYAKTNVAKLDPAVPELYKGLIAIMDAEITAWKEIGLGGDFQDATAAIPKRFSPLSEELGVFGLSAKAKRIAYTNPRRLAMVESSMAEFEKTLVQTGDKVADLAGQLATKRQWAKGACGVDVWPVDLPTYKDRVTAATLSGNNADLRTWWIEKANQQQNDGYLQAYRLWVAAKGADERSLPSRTMIKWAWSIYEQKLELIPAGDFYNLDRAEMLYLAGDIAQRATERVLKVRANKAQVNSQSADIAAKIWRKYLEFDADASGRIRYNLVIACYHSGSFTEAYKVANEVKAKFKDSPEFMYTYACVCSCLGKIGETVDTLKYMQQTLGWNDMRMIQQDVDLDRAWKENYAAMASLALPKLGVRVESRFGADNLLIENKAPFELTNIAIKISIKGGDDFSNPVLKINKLRPGEIVRFEKVTNIKTLNDIGIEWKCDQKYR